MPSITAIPHAMLIDRTDPLALPLSTVWATTPTPKAIRIKVPKNSAAASRAVPLSMRGILLHAQHDDVLPRQGFDDFVDREALGLELLPHFLDAHFVQFEDRHLRIFLPELEQDQAAAGFEGVLESLQENLRLLQL